MRYFVGFSTPFHHRSCSTTNPWVQKGLPSRAELAADKGGLPPGVFNVLSHHPTRNSDVATPPPPFSCCTRRRAAIIHDSNACCARPAGLGPG